MSLTLDISTDTVLTDVLIAQLCTDTAQCEQACQAYHTIAAMVDHAHNRRNDSTLGQLRVVYCRNVIGSQPNRALTVGGFLKIMEQPDLTAPKTFNRLVQAIGKRWDGNCQRAAIHLNDALREHLK